MINIPPMESLKPPSEGARLRFFTSSEVADILKMHPQVITRKLQSGDIAGYKLGKDWRVSEAQLLEFLERHSNSRAPSVDNSRGPSAQGEPELSKKIKTNRS